MTPSHHWLVRAVLGWTSFSCPQQQLTHTLCPQHSSQGQAATAVILSVKFVDNDEHWAEASHQAALSELAALPVTLPCNKTVPANSNSKMKLIIFAAWKF